MLESTVAKLSPKSKIEKFIEIIPEIATWRTTEKARLIKRYQELKSLLSHYLKRVSTFIKDKSTTMAEIYNTEYQYLKKLNDILAIYPAHLDPLWVKIHRSYLHHQGRLAVHRHAALLCHADTLPHQMKIPAELWVKGILPAWANVITPRTLTSLKDHRITSEQELKKIETQIKLSPQFNLAVNAIKSMLKYKPTQPHVRACILPLHDFITAPTYEKAKKLFVLLNNASQKCQEEIERQKEQTVNGRPMIEIWMGMIGLVLILFGLPTLSITTALLCTGKPTTSLLAFLSTSIAFVLVGFFLCSPFMQPKNKFFKILEQEANSILLSPTDLNAYVAQKMASADINRQNRFYSPVWSGISALFQGSRNRCPGDEESPTPTSSMRMAPSP